MKGLSVNLSRAALLMSGLLLGNAFADEWYVKPQVGIAFLSDRDALANNTQVFDGDWDVQTDTGFLAGLEVGRYITDNTRLALQWEYRTNDSDTLVGGTTYTGNLASNVFYLNAYYDFDTNTTWTPYVGAGLGYVQEIDIDLEVGNQESSYSGDGDIGFQFIAGVTYSLSEALSLSAEARYASFSGIDFTAEENALGQVSDLDYAPLSLGIGLAYRF